VAKADGSADTTVTVSASLLSEGSRSMLGAQNRAFVIHADPDDQKTDPSGNSGSRVVCGVIQRR
jgi:Cu-Zn family superoxide dismutase